MMFFIIIIDTLFFVLAQKKIPLSFLNAGSEFREPVPLMSRMVLISDRICTVELHHRVDILIYPVARG